jgi:hypothetical protein
VPIDFGVSRRLSGEKRPEGPLCPTFCYSAPLYLGGAMAVNLFSIAEQGLNLEIQQGIFASQMSHLAQDNKVDSEQFFPTNGRHRTIVRMSLFPVNEWDRFSALNRLLCTTTTAKQSIYANGMIRWRRQRPVQSEKTTRSATARAPDATNGSAYRNSGRFCMPFEQAGGLRRRALSRASQWHQLALSNGFPD